MGPAAVAIHHVGSTAIPGLSAKPIVDTLVEVRSLSKVEARSAAMASAGHEAKGEHGIAGRRYFRKNNGAGIRTHHVHVLKSSPADVIKMPAFRDYMRARPDDASRYSDPKIALAKGHPDDNRADWMARTA